MTDTIRVTPELGTLCEVCGMRHVHWECPTCGQEWDDTDKNVSADEDTAVTCSCGATLVLVASEEWR